MPDFLCKFHANRPVDGAQFARQSNVNDNEAIDANLCKSATQSYAPFGPMVQTGQRMQIYANLYRELVEKYSQLSDF